MFSLLRKEINSFLGSVIGYLVIVVFLAITGLFAWILPDTDFNIITSGYATLDAVFILAPWVFMFLIPAITMRSFAEENKTGTIELLLTKPLTDFQIVAAKYFAGIIIVLFALLPTLVYYGVVNYLASPSGNLDHGGIRGSYIGLFLLGSAYVSIGIFSSCISNNQIISFIFAVLITFIFHLGFDFLSNISYNQDLNYILSQLGMNAHYSSLSRGVIDTRDAVYFITLTMLFLSSARFVLEKRKW
ncbi:MAG: gliding motility-associated ABC transporter permease subunit GldF [Bacteroidetes bacterium]|nr:gliding motility-associated ABC transporter permease subunit GldF [Bacteroidota bacterium]